jgi:hypothetical protein
MDVIESNPTNQAFETSNIAVFGKWSLGFAAQFP